MMRLCALALTAIVTVNSPGQAALLDTSTRAFRSVLAISDLSPLPSFEALKDHNKRNEILIIFGKVDSISSRLEPRRLNELIAEGLSILIVTDHSTKELTRHSLGVWVDGDVLTGGQVVPKHRLYRNSVENCPLLLPTGPTRSQFDAPFSFSLNNVATNGPSYLRRSNLDSSRQTFAILPEGCRGVELGFPKPPPGLPISFAACGTIGPGRYMVIADHSIFVNGMLMADNDNLAFAFAVVDWISQGGERKDVLFVDDGTIRTYFDINPAKIDPPLPHPDVLMPAADQLIIGLERENAFNRVIEHWISPGKLLRISLVYGGALLGVYALYRITAGKLKLSARDLRLPDHVEDLAGPNERPPGQLLRDYSTAVQEMAQRFIDDVNMNDEPVVDTQSAPSRRLWERRIASIWRAASVTSASQSQFLALMRDIEAARAAITSREIRLQSAESAP